mgnify:FL=1
MAINENKRLAPIILKADQNAYISLSDFKGYQPANPDCTREHLAQTLEEMRLARQKELQLEGALAAARDASRQAEWRFHNAMLDVKAQVIAQYGANSDEVQALGLKKKSERRKPSRRLRKSQPD